MTLWTVAIGVGFLIWLMMRLTLRRKLEMDTVTLRTKINQLFPMTRGRQTLIPEYVMSDEHPYLKRYAEETIENMELYGESTAELDLQDEEDG